MYDQILRDLAPSGTKLVAVSKTKSQAEIMALYELGQRIFGENRTPELVEKYENLPKDIEWHFIGHLQRNKVRQIAPFIHFLHGIDSFRLLKEIDKEAQKNERVIDGLLQFKIAEEETKYGFDLHSAREMLASPEFGTLKNVRLCGVMGMATFTDDKKKVRSEFIRLRQIFDQLKTEFFAEVPHFKERSMGMSGDYLLAIEEGSTMVRIGSLLFGPRNY